MSDQKIPLDLRYISEKEEGEESITDKQIDYIIHLTGCKSKDIEHLGKWQASELLDEIIDERDENREIDRDLSKGSGKSKKQGCSCLWAFVLLVVVCFFAGKCAIESETAEPLNQQPEEKPELIRAADAKPTEEPVSIPDEQPITAEPIAEETPIESMAEDIPDQTDEILLTLEGVELPADLLVLSEVQLLNPAGKETVIPADAKITILSRKEGGTLTLRSGGETYVGNEYRLKGKVRLEKD
ncbi:MAG: hypothetical protein ACSHX9_02175 [Luteolibacter sp.]